MRAKVIAETDNTAKAPNMTQCSAVFPIWRIDFRMLIFYAVKKSHIARTGIRRGSNGNVRAYGIGHIAIVITGRYGTCRKRSYASRWGASRSSIPSIRIVISVGIGGV